MSTVIDSLVSAINNAVKANGTKAITGNILQVVLDNMVGTLTQINGLLNVNQVNSKSDVYGSASAARQAVPDNLKTEGLAIAYKLSTGWVIEQNKNIAGTWTADVSWQTVGPVSVSQNSQTGKTEILIGNTPALIVDNKPTKDSNNLVTSGGVANGLQFIEDATCDIEYVTNTYENSEGLENGYVSNTGEVSSSSDYRKTTLIDIQENDKITVLDATNVRFWAWFFNGVFVSGEEYSLNRVAPAGVNGVIISFDESYVSEDEIRLSIERKEIASIKNNALTEIERIEDATCNVTEEWVNYDVDVQLSNGYISNTGEVSTSSNYRRTQKIAIKPGEKLEVTGVINVSFWAWFNGENFISGLQYGKEKIAPDGVDSVVVSCDIDYITGTMDAILKRYEIVKTENNALETKCGLNVLNPAEVVINRYMNPDGTTGSGDYCYTGYIEVDEGDKLVVDYGDGLNTNKRLSFVKVAAFNADKIAVPASGSSVQIGLYTVPSGIKYVRLTLNVNTPPEHTMISKHGEYVPYVPYEETTTAVGGHKVKYDIWHRKNEPLSDIAGYMLNNLAFKPIGQLKKPYICLTTDDGLAMLASYTIPMCVEKGVPLTMAFWPSSEVLVDDTMRAVVMDAVNNHGFCISRHGDSPWVGLSEASLRLYVEIQNEKFAEKGITPIGACFPFAQVSPLVAAFFGGVDGVCRSAYDGVGNLAGHLTLRDSLYTNTGRCNLYALTSCSIGDGDLAMHKAAVDYVKANGGIVMRHWHDNTTDLDSAGKAKLEGLIDYGLEQGVEFITLADLLTSKCM